MPGDAAALVRDVGHGTGLPLVVEPSVPSLQLWIDAQARADAAPLAMTLSDGGRWRRDALPPGWDYSMGLGLERCSAAIQLGAGTLGVAMQVDLLRRGGWLLATAAAARVGGGEEYDLSVVPVLSTQHRLNAWATLVPFGAARVRRGKTLYEVQGWSADRSHPFATALTRDVALAPMAGVAAVTRFAELRLTAGWEIFLVNQLVKELRPTDLRRDGGPFALLALRLRLGEDL
ncbi:MAG TPA: hypothetical protein VLT61_09385 [Anaeromyxobacteraceae bacterium]|nr:hypothetical protein [Anaeromyxobacteraceae bacterium]